MAKRAKILALYADDDTAADVQFTHKDGTTETVTRLAGLPLGDKDATTIALAAYEDAMQASIDAKALRVKGPKAIAVGDDLNLTKAP